MPTVGRRRFLALSGAAAGAAATTALTSSGAAAARPIPRFDKANAMLYDATKCVGCRACLRACRQANELKPDKAKLKGVAYDFPRDLSAQNWMVIQAYRKDGAAGKPGEWTFIRKACMHCNLPACATACPVAALHKTPAGPVLYEESRCIGCRYCQLACPYCVPRYEWVSAKPRVRKCKLCFACAEACPTGALVQGTRAALIKEARRRIREKPDRYVDHVYGEHEAGGACSLIISGVSLELCGLPKLPPMPRSRYADAVMGSLPGWIIGMGLFLGGARRLMNRRKSAAESEPEEESAPPAPTDPEEEAKP